jgi:hypothetical protein
MVPAKKISFATGMLLVFVASAAYAQTFSRDVQKMREALGVAKVSFDFSCSMYSAHNSGKMIQQTSARYYLWEGRSFYITGEVELLTNEAVSIAVNHTRKTVLLNKSEAKKKGDFIKQMLKLQTDTLVTKNMQVFLKDSTLQSKTWQIKYNRPVGGVSSIEISLQLPSCYPLQVVLYYSRNFGSIYGTSPEGVSLNNTPRLVIDYRNYRDLDQNSRQLFATGRYVRFDAQGRARLVEKYRTYTLADYYKK